MLPVGVIGRVDSFHAHVETEDEEIEVEAQAKTIPHSYLLVKLVYLELSAPLLGIVEQSPNVARVDKKRAIQLPKEIRAILGAQV